MEPITLTIGTCCLIAAMIAMRSEQPALSEADERNLNDFRIAFRG